MLDFVRKLLGGSNDAQIKKLDKTIDAIEALEDEYRKLTDEQLQAKTAEFKKRLENGETEDDILPDLSEKTQEAIRKRQRRRWERRHGMHEEK